MCGSPTSTARRQRAHIGSSRPPATWKDGPFTSLGWMAVCGLTNLAARWGHLQCSHCSTTSPVEAGVDARSVFEEVVACRGPRISSGVTGREWRRGDVVLQMDRVGFFDSGGCRWTSVCDWRWRTLGVSAARRRAKELVATVAGSRAVLTLGLYNFARHADCAGSRPGRLQNRLVPPGGVGVCQSWYARCVVATT